MNAIKSNITVNILLVIIPLSVCLITAEISLRVFMADELLYIDDERSDLYSHHDTLGWTPIPNFKGSFKVENEIEVRHNKRGFRDDEHVYQADKKRMIVLGDSFVWGFSVEAEDRFTDLLQNRLNDWEIYNLGVSGYGTDQEYLAMNQNLDYYKPDLVLLVFCTDNDLLDNSMNIRYRDYYKSYFQTFDDGLKLMGIPVPKGPRYYFGKNKLLFNSYILRLAVKSYYKVKHPLVLIEPNPTLNIIAKMQNELNEKGINFVIGLQRSSDPLENFLEKESIEYVLLENTHIYNFAGGHWNPEGHRVVADRIENYLNENQSF